MKRLEPRNRFTFRTSEKLFNEFKKYCEKYRATKNGALEQALAEFLEKRRGERNEDL